MKEETITTRETRKVKDVKRRGKDIEMVFETEKETVTMIEVDLATETATDEIETVTGIVTVTETGNVIEIVTVTEKDGEIGQDHREEKETTDEIAPLRGKLHLCKSVQ